MSKAINWPAQYLSEVINEDTTSVKIALRLGDIYHKHCYYVPDEVVDIRVNHNIIRQGIVVGEMKLCKINELTPEDLEKEKSGLKSIDEIVSYLAKTYNQEVTPETEVTAVYYKNKPAENIADRVDDPHM